MVFCGFFPSTVIYCFSSVPVWHEFACRSDLAPNRMSVCSQGMRMSVGGRENVFACISFYIHLVRFGWRKKPTLIPLECLHIKCDSEGKKITYWIKCWLVIRVQCSFFFSFHISFSDVDRPVMKIWNHITFFLSRTKKWVWTLSPNGKKSCDVIFIAFLATEWIGR